MMYLILSWQGRKEKEIDQPKVLLEMGSQYSRGPVHPSIHPYVDGLEWTDLLRMYQEFRQQSHSVYFLSKPLFCQLFSKQHENGRRQDENENENEMDRDRHRDRLRTVFTQVFDPSNKSTASVLDVFGGLALLLNETMQTKFDFIFSLLDLQTQDLNTCEYMIAFEGATRGLATLKVLDPPSKHQLESLIEKIFQHYHHDDDQDHHDDLEISPHDFIEKARYLPEIIYYMYDLNAASSEKLNVNAIFAQQRQIYEAIARVDHQILLLRT